LAGGWEWVGGESTGFVSPEVPPADKLCLEPDLTGVGRQPSPQLDLAPS